MLVALRQNVRLIFNQYLSPDLSTIQHKSPNMNTISEPTNVFICQDHLKNIIYKCTLENQFLCEDCVTDHRDHLKKYAKKYGEPKIIDKAS